MAEEYVGTKFSVKLAKKSPELEPYGRRLCKQLVDCCREFHAIGTPQEYVHGPSGEKGTSGNYSVRLDGKRVLITPSPKHAHSIKPEHIVLVESTDFESNSCVAIGVKPPSSELLVHAAIYEAKPGVGAVVHWHDDNLTKAGLSSVVETAKEEEAGTIAIARQAAKAVEEINASTGVIVLKNHGLVAIGPTLTEAIAAAKSLYK